MVHWRAENHVHQSGQRWRRCRRQLLTAALLFGALGCAAEEPTPKAAPGLQIDKAQLKPSNAAPVEVSRFDVVARFDGGAAVSAPTDANLHYHWYYDYNPSATLPLTFYGVCDDTPDCEFAVCTKPDATSDEHELLLVVSDGALKGTPNGPLDFPEGTQFDSVTWRLRLINTCP